MSPDIREGGGGVQLGSADDIRRRIISNPLWWVCSLFVDEMRQELSIAIIGNHVQSRPVLRITN